MELRNPFMQENLFQDQPYASLLLVAPHCDFRCPGCQNRDVAAADVRDFSVDEMVAEYSSNPFVDGITVAGLEVCLSGPAFWDDLCKFVARAEIPRVTLYTRFPRRHSVLRVLLERLAAIPTLAELYVKTGAYVAGEVERTVTLRQRGRQLWTLKLASSNQSFFVIKGSAWVGDDDSRLSRNWSEFVRAPDGCRVDTNIAVVA